ncbi:MAG: DUF4215 domain-containing protein [Polyangiaceae bacterium]
MKQGGRRLSALWVLVSSLAVGAGCDSSNGSGAGGDTSTGTSTGPAIVSGGAQKGPLVLGSSVTASPVDATGGPTGSVFNTQTTSDAGGFDLSLPSPGWTAFEVNGFHFNELSGKLSGAQITLRAFADLSSGPNTVYVNVVTHLGERRVRSLLSQGVSLVQATAQADDEVQAAIHVGLAGVTQGIGSNQMTMLGGDTDPNAYLLAVSAVLLQAATEAAGPGGPVDGQLQEMLNTIAQDMADDGQIAAATQTALLTAQADLNTAKVKANLANRIAALGLQDAAPDIDRILDQDQDGVVNVDDNCPKIANPDQADSDMDGFGDACPPCGNGVLNTGEECDDGNADDTDACLSTCAAAKCGDGVVQQGVESCDDGNAVDNDACNNKCVPAKCGDGVVQLNEECDDANPDDYDDCTTKCMHPKCGDGIVQPALGEACDDGNNVHGDGCFDCYTLAGIWAAGDRTCGIAMRANGVSTVVKCWGDGAYGALGQGDTENRGDQPGELEAMPPIDLGGQMGTPYMGLAHTCAVVDAGSGATHDVKCWGRNTEGQLGLGDTEDRGDEPGELGAALPVTYVMTQNSSPPLPLTTATCGSNFNGVSTEYFCFGANTYGVFANGSTASLGDDAAESPVDATPALLGLAEVGGLYVWGPAVIAHGSEHLCALLNSNGVRCWGRNDSGQLGIGSTAAWGDDPGETVATIPTDGTTLNFGYYPSLGRAHTCVGRPSFSEIQCFGANDKGQLGLGHTQNIGDDPGEIATFPGMPAVANNYATTMVFTGAESDFTCVTLGQVYCWGDNGSGQLGRGDTNNVGDEPGEMEALWASSGISLGGPTQNVGWDRIAFGRAHMCVRLDDDRIKCWGDNSKGQLGLGDTENRGDDPGEMGAALPSVPFP